MMIKRRHGINLWCLFLYVIIAMTVSFSWTTSWVIAKDRNADIILPIMRYFVLLSSVWQEKFSPTELGATHVALCDNIGDNFTRHPELDSGSINADNRLRNKCAMTSSLLRKFYMKSCTSISKIFVISDLSLASPKITANRGFSL